MMRRENNAQKTSWMVARNIINPFAPPPNGRQRERVKMLGENGVRNFSKKLFHYGKSTNILVPRALPPWAEHLIPRHDGRLLGVFLPQLRKFNFWLTEHYFIFQMKQDIKTS